MRFLIFFVKRIIASNRKLSGVSLFSVIASGGIALGVATLIVALNILAGYQSLFSQKLTNLDSHIQTVGYGTIRLPRTTMTIARIKSTLGTTVKDVQPFIDRLALISCNGKKEGVTLKGVMPSYFAAKPLLKCTQGSLSLSNANSIVIGKTLAQKLFAKAGDSLVAFALKNNIQLSQQNMPAIQRFYIAGIYESGIDRYDDAYCYVPKQTAGAMFDFAPDQSSGFEIKLCGIDEIPEAVDKLKIAFGPGYYHQTIYEMYAQVFTWIKLQEKPIPIVLGLIVLVAIFNIVSVSLMIALEKNEHIGILRTLGAKRSVIAKAFLLQGVYLGTLGVVAGNIFAYVLSYLQVTYSIVKLPATVYFSSVAPLEIVPESFILVSAGAMILTLIVALIPSFIASRLSPIDTLKFQ